MVMVEFEIVDIHPSWNDASSTLLSKSARAARVRQNSKPEERTIRLPVA
jgi:hypothetical protein